MSAKRKKRPSRRRVYWAWKSHLEEGSSTFLWAKDIFKDIDRDRVRVRITILK